MPPDDAGPAVAIGALQLEILHDGAGGGWLGNGVDVDCQWLVGADITGCNEQSNRVLVCAAVKTSGFSPGPDILECGFASADPIVEPSDFTIAVVDASEPDMSPIQDLYVVATSVEAR
jgi:hypothetical protein